MTAQLPMRRGKDSLMMKIFTLLFILLYPFLGCAYGFDELLENGDCTVTGSWQFSQGTSQTTINTNEWYINGSGQFQIDNPTTYNWLVQDISGLSEGTFYNPKYDVVSNTNTAIDHKFSSTGMFGGQSVGTKTGGSSIDLVYVCTSQNAWFKWGVGPGTGTIVVDNFSLKEVEYDTPKAFPSAVGYGSSTRGAYSGSSSPTIYRPTNYATLKTALQASGARIVIPSQGGTYDSGASSGDYIRVTSPYLTYWGQAASGGGVVIKRATIWVETHNVIFRGLTVIPGLTGAQQSNDSRRRCLSVQDGATPGERHDIIFDHCDFLYGSDENFTFNTSLSGNNIFNVSVQYCNLSNPFDTTPSNEDDDHAFNTFFGSYGGSAKSYNISIHHNLIANGRDRLPALAIGNVDSNSFSVYNNVLYNGKWTYTYFIDHGDYIEADIMNNYYLDGANSIVTGTGISTHVTVSGGNFGSSSKVFLGGNIAFDSDGVTRTFTENLSSKSPNPVVNYVVTDTGVTTTSAQVAFAELITSMNVGNNVPTLNSESLAIIEGVADRTLTWKTSVTFPTIVAGTPTTDTDADGMPDFYEDSNGLDKNDATDAHDVSVNGYANVENWANALYSIVTDEEEVPTSTPPDPDTPTPEYKNQTFLDGKIQTFLDGNITSFLGSATALSGEQPVQPNLFLDGTFSLWSDGNLMDEENSEFTGAWTGTDPDSTKPDWTAENTEAGNEYATGNAIDDNFRVINDGGYVYWQNASYGFTDGNVYKIELNTETYTSGFIRFPYTAGGDFLNFQGVGGIEVIRSLITRSSIRLTAGDAITDILIDHFRIIDVALENPTSWNYTTQSNTAYADKFKTNVFEAHMVDSSVWQNDILALTTGHDYSLDITSVNAGCLVTILNGSTVLATGNTVSTISGEFTSSSTNMTITVVGDATIDNAVVRTN